MSEKNLVSVKPVKTNQKDTSLLITIKNNDEGEKVIAALYNVMQELEAQSRQQNAKLDTATEHIVKQGEMIGKQGVEIKDIKRTIEIKTITPEQKRILKAAYHQKALEVLNKEQGVQLTLNVYFDSRKNSSISDIQEAQMQLKEIERVRKNELGRIKKEIVVDMNKLCLRRKGNAPIDEIPAKSFERCLEYIRTWKPTQGKAV